MKTLVLLIVITTFNLPLYESSNDRRREVSIPREKSHNRVSHQSSGARRIRGHGDSQTGGSRSISKGGSQIYEPLSPFDLSLGGGVRQLSEVSVPIDPTRRKSYESNRDHVSHQSGSERRRINDGGGRSQTNSGGGRQIYEPLIPIGRNQFSEGLGGGRQVRDRSITRGGNSFVSYGGDRSSYYSGDGYGNSFIRGNGGNGGGMREVDLGREGYGNQMVPYGGMERGVGPMVGGVGQMGNGGSPMGGGLENIVSALGNEGCGLRDLGTLGNVLGGMVGAGGQNPLLSAIQCLVRSLFSGGRGGSSTLQTIMSMIGGGGGCNIGQLATMVINSLIAGPSNTIDSPELKQAAEDAKRALEAGESLEAVQARLPPGYRIERGTDPGLPPNVKSAEMAYVIETAKSIFNQGGGVADIKGYLPPGFFIEGNFNTYQIRGPGGQFYTGQNAATGGPIERFAANYVENGERRGYAAAKFDVDEPGLGPSQDFRRSGGEFSQGSCQDLSRDLSQYSGPQYSGPSVSASFNHRYRPSNSIGNRMALMPAPSKTAGDISRSPSVSASFNHRYRPSNSIDNGMALMPAGSSRGTHSGGRRHHPESTGNGHGRASRDFNGSGNPLYLGNNDDISRSTNSDRHRSHRTHAGLLTGAGESRQSNQLYGGDFESIGSAYPNRDRQIVPHQIPRSESYRKHGGLLTGGSESRQSHRDPYEGGFKSVGSAYTNGDRQIVLHQKPRSVSHRSNERSETNTSSILHTNSIRGGLKSVGSADIQGPKMPLLLKSSAENRSSGDDVSINSKPEKSSATSKPIELKKGVQLAMPSDSSKQSSRNKENSVSVRSARNSRSSGAFSGNLHPRTQFR